MLQPQLPSKVVEIPATQFRHELSDLLDRVEAATDCVVVTVDNQPRAVLSGWFAYQELCWTAAKKL